MARTERLPDKGELSVFRAAIKELSARAVEWKFQKVIGKKQPAGEISYGRVTVLYLGTAMCSEMRLIGSRKWPRMRKSH
jgi:hypothetical protein